MRNNAREIRDIGRFVRAHREATNANAIAGVPRRRRHVPYLTQADLSQMIGMSSVVISQIEQGKYPNLSRSVLERISRVLEFTQQQNVYLFGLFNERPTLQNRPVPSPNWLRLSIHQVQHPTAIVNPAFDIVSINQKMAAMFGDLSGSFAPGVSAAVSVFQNADVQSFIEDWQAYGSTIVSGMKINYAMFADWRDYIDEAAEMLCATDDLFRQLWTQNDPLVKPTINKRFHSSSLGTLTIMQVVTDIIEVPGLSKVEFIPADVATQEKFMAM